MEPNENRSNSGWQMPGHFLPAIILIAIGALFLLNNLDVVPGINWSDFWPVILIVIGIVKLVDAGPGGHYTGPAVLLSVGVIFLVSNLHLLPFPVWSLWPLLLIAGGLAMLVDRVSWGDRVADSIRRGPIGAAVHGEGAFAGFGRPRSFDGAEMRLVAVFSGGKRKITSDDFRGGVISAVFGGFEVDLRQARMQGDSATIKADVVFGGAELRIPEDWCAVVQGAGVFGGYSDDTVHPPISPTTKRLYVKGGAVFGGVVVKN